jgi:lactate dehydrogenase-like 2-hydroxyacid dehydrogenase
MPRLEIIVNMGVGYESVDLALARTRGIVVTNAGSVNAVDVAESAFGLILDVGRGISAGDRYVRAGHWAAGRMKMTHRVTGRKLGILGMGAIGREIAKRAVAFEMRVFYHNRRPAPDSPHVYCESAEALARAVDVLVVAAPGGEQTRHMVGAAVLDALGPDGVLVNIGRGSVVDQEALIAALRAGRVAGAGLDVFETEPDVPAALLDLPNVVVAPHQAGATYEGVAAAVDVVVENLRAYFAGQPVRNRVA